MRYFAGLNFGSYNYLPACRAWIDANFDRYALNFCRSGRILWAMNGDEPRFLSGPVAWWTVPGPRYVYGSAQGETWEHFYVTFLGERAVSIGEHLLPQGEDTHFRFISDSSRFEATLFRLFEILERDGPSAPRAVLTLEDSCLQLDEQAPPLTQIPPLEKEVRAWLDSVRAGPADQWDLPREAKRLRISEVHLRRLVNKIVGMPPRRFIVERRLECCATRLRSSDEPIKVLCGQCGFCDLPHFTRLFTRRYGTSPAAFRRETQLLKKDNGSG